MHGARVGEWGRPPVSSRRPVTPRFRQSKGTAPRSTASNGVRPAPERLSREARSRRWGRIPPCDWSLRPAGSLKIRRSRAEGSACHCYYRLSLCLLLPPHRRLARDRCSIRTNRPLDSTTTNLPIPSWRAFASKKRLTRLFIAFSSILAPHSFPQSPPTSACHRLINDTIIHCRDRRVTAARGPLHVDARKADPTPSVPSSAPNPPCIGQTTGTTRDGMRCSTDFPHGCLQAATVATMPC